MTYWLHHTAAWFLGSREWGEASRLVEFLTPEAGRVRVLAQAVRAPAAKLRPPLAAPGLLDISLVRGREVWRLAAASRQPVFDRVLTDPPRRAAASRFFGLLRRLVPPEARAQALFAEVTGACRFLDSPQPLAAAQAEVWEIVAALRLLRRLGYVGETPALSPLWRPDLWRGERLSPSPILSRLALSAVNQGLASSQL